MSAEVSTAGQPRMGEGLTEAVAALAASPRLLVALDFDGTLAPFADDAGGARMLPASRAALEQLRGLENTWVAFISGRSLDGLARVTEADPHALLVGSHGVEARLGPDHRELVLDERELSALERLIGTVTPLVDAVDGAFVELKPVGLGVHTRLASPGDADRLWTDVRAAVDGLDATYTERAGKDILEFAVRTITKGDGVRLLRERCGADTVLFAGDDVTDEDGFAALEAGDVGVKVGEGETAAGYRVADPAAIAELLAALAAARATSSR